MHSKISFLILLQGSLLFGKYSLWFKVDLLNIMEEDEDDVQFKQKIEIG